MYRVRWYEYVLNWDTMEPEEPLPGSKVVQYHRSA